MRNSCILRETGIFEVLLFSFSSVCHLLYKRYAHENGCAWDSTTILNAEQMGHLNCLEYAIGNGCPLPFFL
jgi:hypothetical protein